MNNWTSAAAATAPGPRKVRCWFCDPAAKALYSSNCTQILTCHQQNTCSPEDGVRPEDEDSEKHANVATDICISAAESEGTSGNIREHLLRGRTSCCLHGDGQGDNNPQAFARKQKHEWQRGSDCLQLPRSAAPTVTLMRHQTSICCHGNQLNPSENEAMPPSSNLTANKM